jgi:hypothetical protein
MQIIGFCHFVLALFISFFFIFKKSYYDYIFLYYSMGVLLSWTLFNGECVITYYIKLLNDNNYIPGKDVNKNIDMYLFDNSEYIMNIIINILMIIWWYCLYIVFSRNKIPIYISLSFISIFIFYKLLIILNENHHINNNFLFIQNICRYIIIIIIMLYTYNLIK